MLLLLHGFGIVLTHKGHFPNGSICLLYLMGANSFPSAVMTFPSRVGVSFLQRLLGLIHLPFFCRMCLESIFLATAVLTASAACYFSWSAVKKTQGPYLENPYKSC
jgi:hypothetical protein